MIRKLMVALALSLTMFSSVAIAKPLTLNQILEATCRVHAGGAYGSGTCVKKEGDNYLILTNAHVVGGSKQVTVEFFPGGQKTNPISGEVVWRAFNDRTDVDFSIVSVPASSMSGYVPRIIPLVHQGHKIADREYIASAGCPGARWAVAWEGYTLTEGENRVMFTPPPEGGQSGSGIHVLVPDDKGELHTRVGAVLTWRIGQGGMDANGIDLAYGGAIPVQTLYNLMSNTHKASKIPANYKQVDIVPVPEAHAIAIEDYEVVVGHYAKDIYGKYHQVWRQKSTNRIAVFVTDAKIVDWYVYCPTCPNYGDAGLPLPGRPSPNPGQNPFGSQPPNIGSPPPNSNDPQDDKDKDKIKELEKAAEVLKGENQLLRDRVLEITGQKMALEVEITQLKDSVATLNADNLLHVAKLAELQVQLADKEKLLADVNKNLDETKKAADATTNDLAKVVETKDAELEKTQVALETTTWWTWVLGLFGGTSVSVLIGQYVYAWWTKSRPAIKSKIDSVQDIVDARLKVYLGEATVNSLRSTVDTLQTNTGDAIDARLKAYADGTATLPTLVSFSPAQQVSFNPTQLDNSFAKRFVDARAKFGEKVENLALYSVLYKEALQQLAKEDFVYSGDRFEDQIVVSQKLKAWVEAELVKRLPSATFKLDNNLYNEAFTGLLLKEAVDKLAGGHFNAVATAKETAATILKYVDSQYTTLNGTK